MPAPITYTVWRFKTAQERDSKDIAHGKFLDTITSYKEALELQFGGGYLAFYDEVAQKWISYPEMASSYGEKPWASIPKGN